MRVCLRCVCVCTCVCECVCARARVCTAAPAQREAMRCVHVCICVYVCARECTSVCMCVRALARAVSRTILLSSAAISSNESESLPPPTVCACVLCACVWARARICARARVGALDIHMEQLVRDFIIHDSSAPSLAIHQGTE